MTTLKLTWSEVCRRWDSRGRFKAWNACRSCALHFIMRGVPCLEHTLPDERAARARAIGVTR